MGVSDILQPTHLVFILVVALLVLGPKRLPEVGRQLGSGLRDFRAAINGERAEHHDSPTPPAVQLEQMPAQPMSPPIAEPGSEQTAFAPSYVASTPIHGEPMPSFPTAAPNFDEPGVYPEPTPAHSGAPATGPAGPPPLHS
ncbi:MAG: Sec-independent protein translocase subunit TatA/TatB [Solirubrobacteraceae bacterium]